MQVPTHLVVHCSALADLGCLIRSAFPSPPACPAKLERSGHDLVSDPVTEQDAKWKLIAFCLRAPESVGGMLEKVSGCGAGVERMAASATASMACAAAAAAIPSAASQPLLPVDGRTAPWPRRRIPGRGASHSPTRLPVAIHLRDVAASLRLRGRYDGPTSDVLFLEREI